MENTSLHGPWCPPQIVLMSFRTLVGRSWFLFDALSEAVRKGVSIEIYAFRGQS